MNSPMVKVRDLAKQVRGVTYRKGDASKVPLPGYSPVLRAGNITEDGLVFDDLVYVPTCKIGDRQRVRKNDVLIAASSGSLDVVGKASSAKENFDGGFGAFCKVLRPNSKVDPRYFAHFFKTKHYRQRVSALAAGANINNLRNEHLDNMEIRLPPLAEQRRIAAILDQADALRAKRRQALAELNTLTQSIFLEMFGDPRGNPLGWPRVELADVISSGPQNGLYKPAGDYGSGTLILRIDGFYDGKVIDLGALKRVRILDTDLVSYRLQKNDIVINRVNSMSHLGKCALVPELGEPIVFESNMMRLRVDSARADPRYVVQFLLSAFIKSQITNCAKHAVNQSSINQRDVGSFKVNLPPTGLQREFAKRCKELDSIGAGHVRQFNELGNLFAALQQRAFRGDL